MKFQVNRNAEWMIMFHDSPARKSSSVQRMLVTENNRLVEYRSTSITQPSNNLMMESMQNALGIITCKPDVPAPEAVVLVQCGKQGRTLGYEKPGTVTAYKAVSSKASTKGDKPQSVDMELFEEKLFLTCSK